VGKYTNIKTFNKVLWNFLEPGKWVEANKGYCGHADKVKRPANDANPADKQAMQERVSSHHEMLNRWLKNWGIFSQVFHHHILRHGNAFCVCMVVTQLTIKNGKPLFVVEYE
jgi:hypothetical protein